MISKKHDIPSNGVVQAKTSVAPVMPFTSFRSRVVSNETARRPRPRRSNLISLCDVAPKAHRKAARRLTQLSSQLASCVSQLGKR
jgi:hypothetical protein